MTHRITGYANPAALADTDWLESHLDDPTLAIVEVDEDTTAYDAAHIPGAVALNWTEDLRAAPRRDFVTAQELSTILGDRSISDQQTIVLYGGNNNWFAAYAYWLLRLRAGSALRLGLTAVIEDRTQGLSYWALKHAAEKPDFHRAESFQVALA